MRLSRTSSAESIGAAVLLLYTVFRGATIGSPRIVSARRSAAAASNGVWNGLGTASRFERTRRPSRTTSTASTTLA